MATFLGVLMVCVTLVLASAHRLPISHDAVMFVQMVSMILLVILSLAYVVT